MVLQVKYTQINGTCCVLHQRLGPAAAAHTRRRHADIDGVTEVGSKGFCFQSDFKDNFRLLSLGPTCGLLMIFSSADAVME